MNDMRNEYVKPEVEIVSFEEAEKLMNGGIIIPDMGFTSDTNDGWN